MIPVLPHPVVEQPKWTRLPIRTRPHRNPLADNDDPHCDNPAAYRSKLNELQCYAPTSSTASTDGPRVEFVDIGCAFGGMLFALAPQFPMTLMLGLEIRGKVVQFAQTKRDELRKAAAAGGAPEAGKYHDYGNVWFDQCNVMKFGCNCFDKGQLSRMFFCHPDPHWKKANVRRRIMSPGLVPVYAHWLKVGGLLYTCSDVPELEAWMIESLDACPLFKRVTDEEIAAFDAFERGVLETVISTSEDAQRAVRKKLAKNFAIHRRIAYSA